MTVKIALACLNEFNEYYDKEYGLSSFGKILRKRQNRTFRCN